MSQDNNHDEWLSLIEISGPFLAVPVLKKAFPQGLEAVDGRVRKYLRQAYDEWCEARDNDDPQLEELHRAWIREVLARGLEYDEEDTGELLKRGEAIPATLHIALAEHGVTLSPDYALVDGQKVLLLIQAYHADTDLDAAISQQGWVATPAERMVQLCRTTGCRLGLVTNGERWLLIDAPVGSVVTYASWYARLWGQEPLTLQAFITLLGVRRFFVDASEQLPALFDESLQHQEEVTDALGEQVRRAVEVLIQSLDKEDLNSARTLLQDVAPAQLYEAGLTIMMRLVFLLSAEERGLLLMGAEAYEANYAISTLRMQLRNESDEVLERRHDAWARLLATFRAVYGGIEHETLRLPALGGSLFDPDRFPFLEGRPTGSRWRTDDAWPLPIDNRTVLLLLEAIQQYQGRTLSYRALDVEQIGYVYEGLLERTVKRTDAVTVELVGGKGAKKTIHALSELEALQGRDEEEFTRQLASPDALKRSESAIRKDLVRVVDAALTNHLLTACHGDEALRDRLLPIANLLRTDPWGYPLVYAKGAFIVTTGSDRRETGTHYTPKSLTEAIVTETLTPVAYVGPADGTPREQWVLRSPSELLDLKICDPAMGSGAFLVQACRWLAERLVEAWSLVEASGKAVSVDGEVFDVADAKEPLSRDVETRTVIARRLIAERCLYGVDLNPLAVELAKLSIWLVTLAKGRPFGFLDHNLRCGDSLLGIHRLDQLTELSMTPGGRVQRRLFGQNIERAVNEAIALRLVLREMPIHDIHDVEAMARIDADARRHLHIPEQIADAFIGEIFNPSGRTALDSIAIEAGQAIDGNQAASDSIKRRAFTALSVDVPIGRSARRPFHWPLEFPEVFITSNPGFDAFVGNPPYRGGSRMTIDSGVHYRDFVVRDLTENFVGRVDLCVYFLRQVARLSNRKSYFGLVLTNSVAQGHSRDAGLAVLTQEGKSIFRAIRDLPWPGAANVVVSLVWMTNDNWGGKRDLNGKTVKYINPSLLEEKEFEISESKFESKPLAANKKLCFRGVEIRGDGFILSKEEAAKILKDQPSCREVIRPFLTGTELNSFWPKSQETFVITFGERSQEEAKIYTECWDIVVDKVKPSRDAITKQIHEECFWKFWDKRARQFEEISSNTEFLVKARDSTEWAFAYVSTECVVSSKIIIFKDVSLWRFACLQSGVHRVWCENGASTIGRAITYNPTIGLEFFPFADAPDGLDEFAKNYLESRASSMAALHVGMNDLYRLTHSSLASDFAVDTFRNKIVDLDRAVVAAYGWEDLDLNHDFHEVPYLPENDRIRFTISEAARVEVLRRLSELNRQRYEEEIAQGLHTDGTTRQTSRAKRTARTAGTESIQPAFDFDALPSPTTGSNGPAADVLAFLKSNGGWCAKADFLAATNISDGQWKPVIDELIASGKVERQGEKRGARYRAIDVEEASQ